MSGLFKPCTIFGMAALSLIVGIAALCRTFYRNVDLTLDYMGIIVGILAALCTVLIAWQIYALVDVRNIEERFKTIETKRNEDNLRTVLQTYDFISALTLQMATNATKEELLPQSIMFDLLGIATESKLGQFDSCDKRIKELMQTQSQDLSVSTFVKEQYIRIISEVNWPDKIIEYPALVEWIASLNVHPNP